MLFNFRYNVFIRVNQNIFIAEINAFLQSFIGHHNINFFLLLFFGFFEKIENLQTC